MAGGPLQAADDMVRIISNGLTFGGADKFASYMGETDAAERTAAARNRAGIAGDAATLLGYGGGAKAAWNGIKMLPKAIPAAKAVFSKKGALAGLLGVGTLAEYNSRTAAAEPKAAAPAAPKPVAAKAQAKPRATPDQQADAVMAAIRGAATPKDPTFGDLAGQIAKNQGGLSMRQLGTLSEVAGRIAPAAARQPRPQDAVIGNLQSIYAGQYEAEVKALGAAQAEANYTSRLEGLAKMNPMDAMLRNATQGEAE